MPNNRFNPTDLDLLEQRNAARPETATEQLMRRESRERAIWRQRDEWAREHRIISSTPMSRSRTESSRWNDVWLTSNATSTGIVAQPGGWTSVSVGFANQTQPPQITADDVDPWARDLQPGVPAYIVEDGELVKTDRTYYKDGSGQIIKGGPPPLPEGDPMQIDAYRVQAAQAVIEQVDNEDAGLKQSSFKNVQFFKIAKHELQARRLEAHAQYYRANISYSRATECIAIASEFRKVANTMRRFAGHVSVPSPNS